MNALQCRISQIVQHQHTACSVPGHGRVQETTALLPLLDPACLDQQPLGLDAPWFPPSRALQANQVGPCPRGAWDSRIARSISIGRTSSSRGYGQLRPPRLLSLLPLSLEPLLSPFHDLRSHRPVSNNNHSHAHVEDAMHLPIRYIPD